MTAAGQDPGLQASCAAAGEPAVGIGGRVRDAVRAGGDEHGDHISDVHGQRPGRDPGDRLDAQRQQAGRLEWLDPQQRYDLDLDGVAANWPV